MFKLFLPVYDFSPFVSVHYILTGSRHSSRWCLQLPWGKNSGC